MCVIPVKHTEEHFPVQSSVIACYVLMGTFESLLWSTVGEMNTENQVSAQIYSDFYKLSLGLILCFDYLNKNWSNC